MKTIKMVAMILSLFLVFSCYSVQLKVANSRGGEPDDTETGDINAGEMVRKMDTVVGVKLKTNENPINIRDCESGSLHSVEYKSTFGGILLYLVTFGRKRTVKVKYVCVKESNEDEL